jgi:hypothetical protein
MVTNLGEMRAASAPSEFLLNEEIPDCEAYRSAVQLAMARQPSFEEKLPNQARLDPRSMGSLDQALPSLRRRTTGFREHGKSPSSKWWSASG